MNTSIKTKVNRLGRVGQVISILLIIGAIISLACYLGSFISGLIARPDIAIEVAETDPEGITFMIEEVETSVSIGASSLLIWILGLVACVGSVVVCFLFKRVADGFHRCDTPFEESIIRRMTVFAWSLFALSVLQSAYAAVMILPDTLTGGTIWATIGNLSALIIPSFMFVSSLVVLFLTKVFRHGAELQKESDETL